MDFPALTVYRVATAVQSVAGAVGALDAAGLRLHLPHLLRKLLVEVLLRQLRPTRTDECLTARWPATRKRSQALGGVLTFVASAVEVAGLDSPPRVGQSLERCPLRTRRRRPVSQHPALRAGWRRARVRGRTLGRICSIAPRFPTQSAHSQTTSESAPDIKQCGVRL